MASPAIKKAKVIAILPAYNAAKTLAATVNDIPMDVVDDILLVDDCSQDDTVRVARKMGLKVVAHTRNRGYGGNQKTCYNHALALGADVVVMVHPDYQYDPKMIPALVAPILEGKADAVFGSRMISGGAIEGGMPRWKRNGNILLTAVENIVLGTTLTEYHSGFRAYSARALRSINYRLNDNAFVFDTEIIIQLVLKRFKIHEIPIRTSYHDQASTIKIGPALVYGGGIFLALAKYLVHTNTPVRFSQFK